MDSAIILESNNLLRCLKHNLTTLHHNILINPVYTIFGSRAVDYINTNALSKLSPRLDDPLRLDVLWPTNI